MGLPVTAALMGSGGLYRWGPPGETLTPETLAWVYGVEAAILEGGPTLRRVAPRRIL